MFSEIKTTPDPIEKKANKGKSSELVKTSMKKQGQEQGKHAGQDQKHWFSFGFKSSELA